MSEPINYKDTLNLPNTAFPMKADLNVREPQFIADWNDKKIYSRMVSENSQNGKFIMPDGPPYANGSIHMGHTLNKCLKDFVIKYKNLAGFETPFIPGWDCHGLPIEHKVTKDLGEKRKEKSDKEIRELCRKEALSWVEHQREQFERLGILADWKNPYLTLHSSYEAEEVRELGRILDNGILFRGKKPVYWCYALQTALAEAEIEYAPHTSPSIYVKFPFKPSAKLGKFDKPVYAVIWTTTPWTLPSNVAVCVHPDFEYGFFDTGTEYWLIAKELKETFNQATKTQFVSCLKTVKGAELEFEKAEHPFYSRDSVFILGKHVTLEAGTGCVHTAPGHGQDDYYVGTQYNLPILSPVDDEGKFTAEVPEYQGQHVFSCNEKIIEVLKSKNNLIQVSKLNHSYPHCWRSKTPLIFRATSQWFIKMDDEKFNVRKKSLDSIQEKIKFTPDWGIKRLTAMIENRPDWCVSRQRNWGVPIPVFYCTECDHVHMTSKFLNHVADIMENKHGIEAYFEGSTTELLGGDISCPKCNSKKWKKGTDILDVWFDSGVCHSAVVSRRPEYTRKDGLKFQADLYLEGSDQHRGWFQTSLISSIASNGEPPFKHLLTHNFVNDESGRKMSKSLGNYVNPMDLVKTSGAELLRLWTASQDYGQDINFSKESFQRIQESYRKFRNTMRFLLGNLDGFNFEKDKVEFKNMRPLDRWALTKLNKLVAECKESYDKFEFFKVYHLLNNYFTVELSAHYLDLLKDRLYTAGKNSKDRRSAQTVLHHQLMKLVSLIAPITSFLAEECYSFYSGKTKDSVFLEPFPTPSADWIDKTVEDDFAKLFSMRELVTKKLETMRQEKQIGSSLEAKVKITAEGQDHALLQKYQEELCEFFIVSQFELGQGTFLVETSKADGGKCPRCWYISIQVSKGSAVCEKCERALANE